MTVDDKRAFLCALNDLMVRHDIKEISGYANGEIYVERSGTTRDWALFDLGTISEIEEEIKNLK
jgi:hypothetical protein